MDRNYFDMHVNRNLKEIWLNAFYRGFVKAQNVELASYRFG